LMLLEPCGEKNPRPELRAEVLVRSSRVLKGSHLKLELSLPSGEEIAAFGPNLGAKAPTVGAKVEVHFDVREDRYAGRSGFELLLRDVLTTNAPA
jgi:single-stranded DNA-specific DHH superfamily exonuclease